MMFSLLCPVLHARSPGNLLSGLWPCVDAALRVAAVIQHTARAAPSRPIITFGEVPDEALPPSAARGGRSLHAPAVSTAQLHGSFLPDGVDARAAAQLLLLALDALGNCMEEDLEGALRVVGQCWPSLVHTVMLGDAQQQVRLIEPVRLLGSACYQHPPMYA
jgi:hypothetical protein